MTRLREEGGSDRGIDRRTVLRVAALGAVAGPALLAESLSAGEPLTSPPGTVSAAQPLMVINALGGLDDPNRDLDNPGRASGAVELDPRTIREAQASGLTAVNITLGYVAGPEDPFQSTVEGVG